ncbi:undecaprenyl-diphosphate phosphatase [Actinomyces sp. zg-332]|uniref:undecaprenyl-diphosphate phosphatase n=1 Tax=Actinomyces sp. zg-332 TaxID=2708340 RepID=UPI00141EE1E0|nr:undecaprenyl-diphosphate phosphatase [Actinomyces sp. zg-332]QPK93697.1 undecaprenyl-diphosphate phosphatase [Actinomyces sp. zg-332]
MSILEAIIFGIVQGLTEFLPISSSAHLRITSELLGMKDPGAGFTAIIQIGTELAVLIYFFKDIVRIIKKWCLSFIKTSGIKNNDTDVRLGWMIIVGSIPIVILGLLLQDWIETTFRNLWITVLTLFLFAIFLGLADKYGKKLYRIENLSWANAIVFGFAQALALIPGVSRSGGTITAGRLMGYRREDAAKYSFLLAMPAIFGSGFYILLKAALKSNLQVEVLPLIVATVVSFLVGYAVIVFFMRLISTKTFMPFVIYRIGLAGVVTVLLMTKVLLPV